MDDKHFEPIFWKSINRGNNGNKLEPRNTRFVHFSFHFSSPTIIIIIVIYSCLSFEINAIHFVTIRLVVKIGHLSDEWKRRCDGTRRESDKSITIVDSHFNANSTYFISVQLLLLLLLSIRVWVSKWRIINAIHFVTIRLEVEIGHLSDKWKRCLHILYLSNYYYYYCHLFAIEFRNGEQSIRLTLLRYDWLRVVRISHLSGEWKRRTRRESDKSITVVDSRFNANSTYFISVQLLLLLLLSIRVWVSKWRTINAIHFVMIRLVTSSTDQPFIGRVKKTMESDKSIIVVDSHFNANSTYFIFVQF